MTAPTGSMPAAATTACSAAAATTGSTAATATTGSTAARAPTRSTAAPATTCSCSACTRTATRSSTTRAATRLRIAGADPAKVAAELRGDDLVVTHDGAVLATVDDYAGHADSFAGIDLGQGVRPFADFMADPAPPRPARRLRADDWLAGYMPERSRAPSRCPSPGAGWRSDGPPSPRRRRCRSRGPAAVAPARAALPASSRASPPSTALAGRG